jgi:hypothetical protein
MMSPISNGKWKTCLRNTVRSILSQRTPDGFYGADWSGPELSPEGSRTWIEQAKHGGMAVPNQIMTSSDAVAMLTAAVVVEKRK